MTYTEVNFNCNPNSEMVCDVLAANLAEIGFESFIQTDTGLAAYIPAHLFSTNKTDNLIANFQLDAQIEYSFNEMEDKNWNEAWEKNFFQPIIIENRCIVYSSFHETGDNYEYKILIDPKMAFGTGHHQTTRGVMEEMLEMDFQNKMVLDMGCGTALLAILASMKQAKQIDAIDIDEWAYNNAVENVKLNGRDNIHVMLGDAGLLINQAYDIIIANINRNILLQDIPRYKSVLNTNGTLIMSGFYTEDIPILEEACLQNGLKMVKNSQIDNWAVIICQ